MYVPFRAARPAAAVRDMCARSDRPLPHHGSLGGRRLSSTADVGRPNQRPAGCGLLYKNGLLVRCVLM